MVDRPAGWKRVCDMNILCIERSKFELVWLVIAFDRIIFKIPARTICVWRGECQLRRRELGFDING